MEFSAENLHAGYVEDIDILRGLSVKARHGQITTIIGANGVGKSTLLKCAIGQLRPHTGTITYGEHNLIEVETHNLVRIGIAYIAQRHSIYPHMTVLENLELGMWSQRKDRAVINAAIERVFEGAPILADFRRRKAGDLSGGQQRILEMQRSLMTNPQLMLIDEPSVGLDPKMTTMIYEHLRQLSEKEGRTILMVDQNVIAGTDIADHIYVLELGENKFDCTKKEFNSIYMQSISDWLI